MRGQGLVRGRERDLHLLRRRGQGAVPFLESRTLPFDLPQPAVVLFKIRSQPLELLLPSKQGVRREFRLLFELLLLLLFSRLL